ncbi:hypothetical protein I2I11_20280 [Pontibacter sp. 172403-2]|uniref:hypothetical protein n=1 Tax=Pontibacter rufus TaxID=2791028 RepID=UPI0018AFF328|nr:hypothetical protein [Pontibacter sp. 172403-2]MBF9255646.1 hypothetical protein [Pontibacter sp. 172403-2]
MERLQKHIETIKGSDLPEGVKQELLEEIQRSKPDKYKIAMMMLRVYEVGKDIFKLLEDKF